MIISNRKVECWLTDLEWRKVVVDKECQPSNRHNQELDAESVVVTVIGGLELSKQQIDGAERSSNEDHLHRSVVQRDEIGKQVEVATGEHHHKHHLRLARKT